MTFILSWRFFPPRTMRKLKPKKKKKLLLSCGCLLGLWEPPVKSNTHEGLCGLSYVLNHFAFSRTVSSLLIGYSQLRQKGRNQKKGRMTQLSHRMAHT